MNRRSRSAADQLLIEVYAPDHDEIKIRSKLIRIVKEHDEGILKAEEDHQSNGDAGADEGAA